eukprot:351507-Chlamydomonas_euryale.AAC.1
MSGPRATCIAIRQPDREPPNAPKELLWGSILLERRRRRRRRASTASRALHSHTRPHSLFGHAASPAFPPAAVACGCGARGRRGKEPSRPPRHPPCRWRLAPSLFYSLIAYMLLFQPPSSSLSGCAATSRPVRMRGARRGARGPAALCLAAKAPFGPPSRLPPPLPVVSPLAAAMPPRRCHSGERRAPTQFAAARRTMR